MEESLEIVSAYVMKGGQREVRTMIARRALLISTQNGSLVPDKLVPAFAIRLKDNILEFLVIHVFNVRRMRMAF